MRTTIDIDDPILSELKLVGRQEGKSLGRIASDLLAAALASRRKTATSVAPPLEWISKPMGARVDLDDRDALLDAMEW